MLMFIYDVLRDLVQFVQLKNVKNTHGRLFTKSETPPCVFFTKSGDTSHMFKETNNSDYKLFLHKWFL